MKNLIYQYWQGNMPNYAKISSSQIKEYADYVGADYRFDFNSPFFKGDHSDYMNCLRPIFDIEFEEYNNVLFLDMDIFPIHNIKENIFDLDIKGIAMAEEVMQPVLREQSTSPINTHNDKKWADIIRTTFNIKTPVDDKNRPLVYNSGVVLYSAESRIQARNWLPYTEYRKAMNGMNKFYQLDQNYLGAVAFSGVTEFTELDNKWNAQVHYTGDKNPRDVVDNRKSDTCFVHVQTRPRNILNKDMIYDIVNKSPDEWGHR